MNRSGEPLVRILLVDDHELFREGIARLLAAEPAFDLVAHCGTIEEGLEILKHHPVDLVLLDIDLGPVLGTEMLRRLPSVGYAGKILVITGGVDDARARELVSLGASGIFLKHSSPALLCQSIRQVMEGWTWLDQHHFKSLVMGEPGVQPTRATFTGREKQVLNFVLQGLQNKEIAAALQISESAVKATMQQLFNKTGVRTRSQLVRVVLEQYRDEFQSASGH